MARSQSLVENSVVEPILSVVMTACLIQVKERRNDWTA